MSISIDPREATGKDGNDSPIFKGLKEGLGEENVTKVLLGDCIDFVIHHYDEISDVIQRKTANEMVHPQSAYKDIIEMGELENVDKYILLEGSLSGIERWSKMPRHAIIGGVDTILLPRKYGGFDTKIIPSPNREWTIAWLIARAKKVSQPHIKKEFHVTRPTQDDAVAVIMGEKQVDDLEKYVKNLSVYLISGLPDISWTLGERIFDYYGSVGKAFVDVDNWDSHIEGIGFKKKETAKRLINFKLH